MGSWPPSGRATWSLLRVVERRPLSRLARRWEESRGIHRREWSRIVVIMVIYQGVMEPHGIRYRKWNRIMVVIVICQGVRIY